MKMIAALVLIALPLAPSAAYAAPFAPDHFRIDVLNIAFASSGTNQFCWQCEDGDPTNDLMGTVDIEPGDQWGGQIFVDVIHVTAQFTGTATDFTGLAELLTLDVRVGLYDLRTPSEGAPGDNSPNPEYTG